MACSLRADPLNEKARQTKAEIIQLATSYFGQGDPDRSKQRSLEILVDQLVAETQPLPLQDRLPLLEGSWQQIWGPYDYRSDDRGIDPNLDPDHIYQVILPNGVYYNINPDPRTDGRQIGILRGEYLLDPEAEPYLNVRFTKFNKITEGLPEGLRYSDLALLSEKGTLVGETWLLPSFVVRWFFDKGSLREVYTDQDLRITFGSQRANREDNFIYILKRVDVTP